jgi:hypothetical protein
MSATSDSFVGLGGRFLGATLESSGGEGIHFLWAPQERVYDRKKLS